MSAGGPSYWTSLASPFDPGHSYLELVAEWDNGLLDGFANDPVYTISGQQISIPGFAQTVVPPNETPIYSLLAATYVIGDRMFSSGLVPSFPAHQYMFAAQSIASDSPDETPWGCDAPSDALVSTFGPNNTLGPPVYPCFDYASLADLLDAKGVSWKYYTDRPKTVGGNIDAIGAIQQLRFGSGLRQARPIPGGVRRVGNVQLQTSGRLVRERAELRVRPLGNAVGGRPLIRWRTLSRAGRDRAQ